VTDWRPYLESRYRDGGRELPEVDCFGLVRLVRHEVFGLPLLPEWGACHRFDLRAATAGFRAETAALEHGLARPGALACVLRGALFLHVGVVVDLDGRLGVLDTAEASGPRWRKLCDFERAYPRVEYYL
jgi:hypothetical protein